MVILVDDDRVDIRRFDQGSVEEALRQVQSDLSATGQVVVGLRCDGEDLAGDAMVETLQKPVSSFDKLEVFTSTRTVLVREAMAQAETALNDTDAECKKAADLMNAGSTAEGVVALGECMKVWQQVHEAVAKSIDMLGLDIDTITVDDQPIAQVLDRPKEMLLQIKEALTAQDYVLLADILQYELAEITGQWRAIAARLRQEVDEPSSTQASANRLDQPPE